MNEQLNWTTRTIEEKGIELPWERRANPWEAHPAMGSSGIVFIPVSTLEELAEQDVWDSQFGSAFLLGYHEGLALEQAGLAVRETKGGYHRSEKLLKLLRERGVIA